MKMDTFGKKHNGLSQCKKEYKTYKIGYEYQEELECKVMIFVLSKRILNS